MDLICKHIVDNGSVTGGFIHILGVCCHLAEELNDLLPGACPEIYSRVTYTSNDFQEL